MSLNPKIAPDAQGVLWLNWTSDPKAEGYRIITPSGSAIAGKTRTVARLGRSVPISVSIAPLYAQAYETAVYPPVAAGLFGALLLATYPRPADPPGPVREIATFAEFKAAWENPEIGADYTCKGRTLNGDGKELVNATRGAVTTRYRFGDIVNAQLNTQGRNISLGRTMAEPMILRGDTPQGLKVDHGSDRISWDGLVVKDSTGQGLLIGSGSAPAVTNIRGCNFITSHDGSNDNKDHGVYAAHVDGFCFYNWLGYGDQAYVFQGYPQGRNGLVVAFTWNGGVTRGGGILGTELTDAEPTRDIRLLAGISTNAPGAAGFNVQIAAPGCIAEDCIAFGNRDGDISSKLAQKNLRHLDPMYVDRAGEDFHLQADSPIRGLVDPANYPWLPPTDLDGKPRTAGTAGAYA